MEKQKIIQEQNLPPPQPFKVELYTAVAVIFFIAAALCVKFFQSNADPSFHKEIFASQAISYIKNDDLFALSEGAPLRGFPGDLQELHPFPTDLHLLQVSLESPL